MTLTTPNPERLLISHGALLTCKLCLAAHYGCPHATGLLWVWLYVVSPMFRMCSAFVWLWHFHEPVYSWTNNYIIPNQTAVWWKKVCFLLLVQFICIYSIHSYIVFIHILFTYVFIWFIRISYLFSFQFHFIHLYLFSSIHLYWLKLLVRFVP